MAEHVASADHSTPHGQFADLQQLRLPHGGVAEVNVGAELDDAMAFLSAGPRVRGYDDWYREADALGYRNQGCKLPKFIFFTKLNKLEFFFKKLLIFFV